MDKYNLIHTRLSMEYNRSLMEGRFADSVMHINSLISIAELENRSNDVAVLKCIKEEIQRRISLEL